jgi:hypothetical protein
MPNLQSSLPSYCLHRASGQAYVNLSGRVVYLGPHGSKVSKGEYDRVVGEWLAAGRRLPSDPCETTIAEIVAAFRKHAAVYYRDIDGKPTSEINSLDIAIKPLLKSYGRSKAVDFGPLSLKAVRDAMVRNGWTRSSINKHVSRIKHIFK